METQNEARGLPEFRWFDGRTLTVDQLTPKEQERLLQWGSHTLTGVARFLRHVVKPGVDQGILEGESFTALLEHVESLAGARQKIDKAILQSEIAELEAALEAGGDALWESW